LEKDISGKFISKADIIEGKPCGQKVVLSNRGETNG
jgi:hypothetical protein